MGEPEVTPGEIDQLKRVARAFMTVEDEIAEKRRELKELNARKKPLIEHILNFMRTYNHEELYLGQGRSIFYRKSQTKTPLNERELHHRAERLRLSDDVRQALFERHTREKDGLRQIKHKTSAVSVA